MYRWRQAAQRVFLKRNALRRGLTLSVGAALWLSLVPTASAATDDKPDQVQLTNQGSLTASSRTWLAQTFTAGVNGQMDRVSLIVGSSSGGGGTVQIQSVSGDTPNGTILAASTYSGFINCCQLTDFTISPPLTITANVQYAIVIHPNIGTLTTWRDNFSDSIDAYTRGKMWMGSTGSWATSTSMGKNFDFETWVLGTSANTAPTVTYAKQSFNVDEGVAPTNSGTFADADGDTVHLTASSGTITYTPSSKGNWTWTGVAADEGPSQPVKITADDGHGNIYHGSFTTQAVNVPPIVTIDGAPSSANEGSTVMLTGSAKSSSADDTTFTYSWTATKDGNPFATGSDPNFSLKPDDEGIYVVTLQATDDGGVPGHSLPVTITGVNVPPTATITNVSGSALVLVAKEQVTFAGTFTEPNALDTHTVTWDFGDHTSSTSTIPAGGSANLNATHPYSAAGTYAVTLTVSDGEGGTGVSQPWSVVIQTPAQAIGNISSTVQGGLTDSSTLNQGQKKSLEAKLNAAADALQRGSAGAACNQLNAFLNEVEADQKSGAMTAGDAKTLTDAVTATQLAMGCFQPLVDFLNGL